jgi:hypothetical protein
LTQSDLKVGFTLTTSIVSKWAILANPYTGSYISRIPPDLFLQQKRAIGQRKKYAGQ